MKVLYIIRYIGWIIKHPLNRGAKGRSIWRYIAWQICSRILRVPVLYPFVNNIRILLSTGHWGATGVIYFGLEEYEDMSFCAHFLRPGDLFVDVGACFGTYTLLAAGVAGARTITYEPNPVTAQWCSDNININKLDGLVSLRMFAIGVGTASVQMTNHLVGANHIINTASKQPSIKVPLTNLDSELMDENPTLIKVDVEGYEQDVLDGASHTLSKESLVAVILEDAGLRTRYHKSSNIHHRMLECGFRSYKYDPLTRDIIDLEGKPNGEAINTLYLKNTAMVKYRVSTAVPFRVRDRLI